MKTMSKMHSKMWDILLLVSEKSLVKIQGELVYLSIINLIFTPDKKNYSKNIKEKNLYGPFLMKAFKILNVGVAL